MRPWQNAVALIATLLAAAALLPLRPDIRSICSLLAFAAIVMLLTVRLRAHGARRGDRSDAGVYDRIERIRAARARRTRRPR